MVVSDFPGPCGRIQGLDAHFNGHTYGASRQSSKIEECEVLLSIQCRQASTEIANVGTATQLKPRRGGEYGNHENNSLIYTGSLLRSGGDSPCLNITKASPWQDPGVSSVRKSLLYDAIRYTYCQQAS